MSVRRFLGANNRDAMRQVRESLGADAMILSSRQLPEGYEILAMAEEALEEKVAQADNTQLNDFSALAQRLLGEVQEMRSMLNQQQTPQVPQEKPLHAVRELVNILQAAGFSSELIRELVAQFSALPSTEASQVVDISQWLAEQLQQRLLLPSMPAELFADGVVALVGPTGVGKTTTTAKLAAHYVMQFGAEALLLVTTDGYRVGAREQLKIYAGLLNVDMYALEDGEGLEQLEQRMQGKKLVLIDTVGMSQRDQRLTQRIAELQTRAANAAKTRLVLLLNSASQRETLAEVVHLFQQYAEQANNHIHDCILTKVDESVRLGGALDVLVREGLTLHFISNGQRVPEDLELPDAAVLIEKALDGVAAEYAEFSQWLASVTVDEAPSQRAHTGKLQAQGKTLASLYAQLQQQVAAFSQLHELREIAELPNIEQAEALAEWQQYGAPVLAKAAARTAHWPRSKPVAGCSWHLPTACSVAAGEMLPCTYFPQNFADEHSPITAAICNELPVEQHVFAALPELELLTELAAKNVPWIAVINRNHRVLRPDGARVAALALRAAMPKHTKLSLQYRGETAQLILSQEKISLPGESARYTLWYGELNSVERNTNLARRFWLTPDYMSLAEGEQLVLEQLAGDELVSLSRQAYRLLEQAGYSTLPQNTLVALASSMAALAVYLEHTKKAPLLSARQRLLSIPGKRGKANARKILSGIMHLFEASAAMQIMSAAGVRSE